MLQIEANRLAHEHFERHFVDRLAVRIDMHERIDMRADVIEHRDEVGLESHGVARHAEIDAFRALMAQVIVITGR